MKILPKAQYRFKINKFNNNENKRTDEIELTFNFLDPVPFVVVVVVDDICLKETTKCSIY